MATISPVAHPRRVPRPPTVPAHAQVQKTHGVRSNQHFQTLPKPTGPYPYRMQLGDVLVPEAISAIRNAGKLVLHVVGDTGGVKNPQPQQTVADQLAQDLIAGGDVPALFYHLGDVVYFYGQASEYYPQFYEPYSHYTAPIVGIPGNHDGDIPPVAPGSPQRPPNVALEPSLAAFTRNFCADRPHLTQEAQEIQRTAMTQPNVYWTLLAPFLTIIGMYTNVPEGGSVDSDQTAWLEAELAAAPADGALVVAMHHPPYSADAHHGGSAYMGGILDAAMTASGRTPHAVFAGHVHNYQRFTRRLNGKDVPYIVAGAGGYWHLHQMALDASGGQLPVPWAVPGAGATLEQYDDQHHGYLRITATATTLSGEYVAVAGHLNLGAPPQTIDTFAIDLTKGSVASGAPAGGTPPAKAKAPARKRSPQARTKART
jgi:hypothetical protein